MPPDIVPTTGPSVSVVCATFRRPDAVARLLRALAAQDLDERFEVVISDDGSGHEVQERLRLLAEASDLDVRVLAAPDNRGPGAARNAGWRACRAPVVAFTDDDCQPAPGWLRAGLAAVRETRGAVVGRVVPHPDQSGNAGPWSRTLRVEDARYAQTANVLYPRADLEAVGGFDERFRRGGEDTDLALRVRELGRPVGFCPSALVRHDVRPGTARQLARESATRWTDLPLVLRQHPALRLELAHHRIFWKRRHPAVLLGIAGVVAAPAAPWALALTAPWLADVLVRHPVAAGRRRRLALVPGTALVDLAEVLACVRGSVRHRTLLL